MLPDLKFNTGGASVIPRKMTDQQFMFFVFKSNIFIHFHLKVSPIEKNLWC